RAVPARAGLAGRCGRSLGGPRPLVAGDSAAPAGQARRSRRRGVVSRRRRNYGGARRSRDGGRTRMATGSVPKLKVLVFGASLREDSLNRKLAALAARVVEQCGGAVDQASMRDFEAPSYDGDV